MLLTSWRLAIATSALTGVWLAALQYDVWWTALSQLANLAVAVVFLALAISGARPGPMESWMRGAAATLMLLVSVGFLAMQHGNLLDAYSIFEHLLTPALVLADYLLTGGRRRDVRWWHPLTWTLPAVAYLAYYVVGDLRVYVDLDPAHPGSFTRNVLLLLGLLLASGYALKLSQRPVPPTSSSSFQQDGALVAR